MTPKEKAIELVDKFLRTYKVSLYPPFNKASDEAKQCALIAVDEIINANPHSNPLNTNVYSTMKYWQEVKQELEKL
jgi:hypothetical protein